MNVSVKDAGVCRKTMTIEIPAEKIIEERDEAIASYAKFANIPGFRKGKAPKHVVAKKYAKEIDTDVEERVLPKYYQAALRETALKVVNVVDATDITLEHDKPVSFDVTVDVEPEFKLPKYTDIPVKEEKVEIGDEQVQEQIDAILNQHATYEAVEGRKVVEGDMAQLTYEATLSGKPLQDAIPEAKGLGSGSGYWVSADDYAFIPGMGKAIVGMKAGDKKEVKVKFPDTFMVKELAGVKTLYSIEVSEVRERKLPILDEAFLENLQVESEEDLRAKIREQLEIQATNSALNKKHQQIIDYLIKKTTIDVPESIVQQQTRNIMYEIAHHRMMAGQTQEQIAEQQETILKEAQERALEKVKLRYIGLGIAKELGLDASKNEIDEEIATMAIRQRKDARELRREMEKNDTITSVGEQICFNKALDYMVKNARTK